MAWLPLSPQDRKVIAKSWAILMCGLPGSGKTTIAKKISLELPAKLISSDKIRKKVFKSSRFDIKGDDFVRALRPKYYNRLFKEVKRYLLESQRVIIDASNMDKQRINLINRLGGVIGKKKILIMVIKAQKKTIAQRMKKIEKMATEKEDFYTAWKRVYGYFEKNLNERKYFWPTKKEGVKIIELCNG